MKRVPPFGWDAACGKWVLPPKVNSFHLVAAVCLALAGCQRAAPLPELKLDDVSPVVRKVIGDAMETARAQPGAAAPSGHLGMILLAHRLPEPALVCFDRARALDPQFPSWPYYAGAILQDRKQFAEARRAFEAHLALAPDSFAGQVRLAEALFALGEKDASLERFSSAIGQRPKSARALFGMGRLLQSQGKQPDAGRFFERALEAFPRYRQARFALAETWRARGDEGKAAELLAGYDAAQGRGETQSVPFEDPLLAEVARLDASSRGTRIRARQLARGGHVGQAARLLESGLRAEPGLAAYRSDLMMYFTHLKQWDKAEEQFRALIDANPDDAVAHAQRGELLVAQGNRELAVESFDTALQIDPKLAIAHYGLGESQLVLGRAASAEDHFRKALAAQPEHARAHASLGKLLVANQNFAEAIPHLLEADDAQGAERVRVLQALGTAYEKAGKAELARETLEAARVLGEAYGPAPAVPAPSAQSKPGPARRAAPR